MGSTRLQLLGKVQVPMALRTIILGVNQTMMMALSMVVITVLVDAPGLGKNIIRALQQVDVGTAFDAGLAIVIIAVVLDRFTTAAGERADPRARALAGDRAPDRGAHPRGDRHRGGAGSSSGGIVLDDPDFPKDRVLASRARQRRGRLAPDERDGITSGLKDAITFAVINPIQGVLTPRRGGWSSR